MTRYQDLIRRLRKMEGGAFDEAADAIEQLERELRATQLLRDAAERTIKRLQLVQSETTERSALVKKIEAFATLPDNWDSYGAKRFSARTIMLAREIAAKLESDDWRAVPCADGPSVWLTRNNENDILEVRASDDD